MALPDPACTGACCANRRIQIIVVVFRIAARPLGASILVAVFVIRRLALHVRPENGTNRRSGGPTMGGRGGIGRFGGWIEGGSQNVLKLRPRL